MDEKRVHKRAVIHGAALVDSQALDNWQPSILLDMSASGISFTHPTLLIKGFPRTVRFRLPESGYMQAAIRVVHSAKCGVPSGYRVGATFDSLTPRTELAILEFLQKAFACP